MRRRTASSELDLVGVVLLGGLLLWTAFGASAGRSTPVLHLLAGIGTATVAGRRLGRTRGLVPRGIASAVLGALLLTFPGLLSAAGPPTGYANSNATLAGMGALAAGWAAAEARTVHQRRAWCGCAVVLAVAVAVSGSVAGTLLLCLVCALLVGAALARWAPLAIVGGLISASLLLGFTVAVAVGGSMPWTRDAARFELWAGGAELAREAPLRGLGVGAFEIANPVTSDADLRWVHHEYLEIAVEMGAVGMLLVLGLTIWAYGRLVVAARSDPVPAAMAAGAVTLVALHGAVDHVWHSPAVLVLLAVLLGAATAMPLSDPDHTRWSDGARMGRKRH